MNSKTALNTIMWISIVGILFSGYLTFTELTAQTCAVGGCKFMLGLPTCAYGLMMYLAVFVIALIGRKNSS